MRWPLQPVQPLQKKHSSNHLSVQKWIRSAIQASQQLTSSIVSYLWNFRHRLVRHYWYLWYLVISVDICHIRIISVFGFMDFIWYSIYFIWISNPFDSQPCTGRAAFDLRSGYGLCTAPSQFHRRELQLRFAKCDCRAANLWKFCKTFSYVKIASKYRLWSKAFYDFWWFWWQKVDHRWPSYSDILLWGGYALLGFASPESAERAMRQNGQRLPNRKVGAWETTRKRTFLYFFLVPHHSCNIFLDFSFLGSFLFFYCHFIVSF